MLPSRLFIGVAEESFVPSNDIVFCQYHHAKEGGEEEGNSRTGAIAWIPSERAVCHEGSAVLLEASVGVLGSGL